MVCETNSSMNSNEFKNIIYDSFYNNYIIIIFCNICICLFVQFTVHDENKIIIIRILFTNNNINSNYLTHSWAIKASTNSILSNISQCFVPSRISHNSLIVLHNAILLGSGGNVILLMT